MIGRWWCRNFHNRLLRPISGKYICAVCLRQYEVEWPVQERWAAKGQKIAVDGTADSIVLSVEG